MAPFQRTTLPAHYSNGQTFGRPSDYRPEYCELLVEVTRAEGISLTAFAGYIGVSRDAVYDWIRRHADFSHAVARAKPIRQLWLERKLLRSRKGAETSAAMFALKNAAPEDWRDVRSVDHIHSLKGEQLTDAQLHEIAAGNRQGDGSVIDGESVVIDTR